LVVLFEMYDDARTGKLEIYDNCIIIVSLQ